MATPESFKLDPVAESSFKPAAPPRQLKSQICKDPSLFNDVDNHAIEEAQVSYKSFRDILWNLVNKKSFTDLEKARVIFRWMTCRDFNAITFADELAKPGSPEQLLLAFKSSKTTYARIFECLARHAGLPCVTITGWAKGVDYRPGVEITKRPINHSWNAVYIDGNWQLVDSHWATRFLQSESNKADLVYEYDDFYFLPEPSQLVYTHLPEDAAWQLLQPRHTVTQFEDYPLLKSYFFANGMRLLPDGKRGVLVAKKGVATLSIGFTGETAFTFKLVSGDDMKGTYNGIELNRYVVQRTKNNLVEYQIRVPSRGDFYLIVFAHLVTDNVPSSENIFKAICEYKIVAASDVPDNVVPFPSCSDQNWGPDTFVSQYSLTPYAQDAIVNAADGSATVAFDKSRPGVRVFARLVKDGVSDATLRQAVSVNNDNNKVTILVKLPEKGEYGLELFANDPQADGEMFTHICQYLCRYSDENLTDTTDGVDDLDSEVIQEVNALTAATYEEGETLVTVVPSEPVEPEEEYIPHSEAIYQSEIEVKPPENFTPERLVDEDAPEPDPETSATHKPFIDIAIFQHVDAHAAEVSKMEHLTFREIIWHLIFARNIRNELDRARAIFLWLCSKDLSKLCFPDAEKGSPEEILSNLQNGLTTYARVYETLCSYANLHCKTLTGLAKGAEYKPGMKFSDSPAQHSWNAVLINGTWQLVDCHWAARRVVGQKTQQASTPDNIRYELDEYYFMPAPSQLVYTHFPDDAKWQLLRRHVTLEEFENLVPVKPAFFKFGLRLLSHADAVIPCEHSSDIVVRVALPQKKKGIAKSLRFTFNLTQEDGTDTYEGVKLNRFGRQEVVNNVCFVTIRPPVKGSYLLIIYAKDLNDKTKDTYGGVCEYKITCDGDRTDPRPFPPCVHTTWGPGDSAAKFDMIPLHKGSLVYTNNGVAEVQFRLITKLRFLAKLKSNDTDEKALAQNVMMRISGNRAIFRVHLLALGEYGLEIYANNPQTGGTSLLHAYQYLIICNEVPNVPLHLFPALPAGSLGPQAAFERCGLTLGSHTDPFLVTDTGDISVSFTLSQPLRMSSKLTLVSETPDKDVSEYILQQSGTENVSFMLHMPSTGVYKFLLFALPQSETSESLPVAFTYLIDCRKITDVLLPFPKQFASFKDGCYLYEPLEGHLQANRPSKGSASSIENVYFKLDVPKAFKVAVVVGGEWTYLQQKDGESWEAEVLMKKHWETERKAIVCASLGENAKSFSTLLEYSM